MKVIEQLLTINQYSRPGRKPIEVKGIILHWTGMPMQRARGTWNFFEYDCPKDGHYSSAHYIIDLNGDIYHAVPDNEVAYHCGSIHPDKASGRIYTDWARKKFGRYAENSNVNSPNNCTIGIEMCVIDTTGNYTIETTDAAAELVAMLLRKYNLTADDIGTHQMVVGWKDCPRYWALYPDQFIRFKDIVEIFMRRESC
jgi:N-acetylmuramoyl-L-alanine amidase